MDLSAISAASVIGNYRTLTARATAAAAVTDEGTVGATDPGAGVGSTDPVATDPGVGADPVGAPTVPAPTPLPAPAPVPEPAEQVDQGGRAWGMLRNLAAGHYKANAAAHLRENFAEEIAAAGIDATATSPAHAGKAYEKHAPCVPQDSETPALDVAA